MKILSASLRLCGLFLLTATALAAQIPTPKDVIGFTPGDDRKLASWASIVDYFKKLDAASDRVVFEEIGKSTMGAPSTPARTIGNRQASWSQSFWPRSGFSSGSI